MKPERWHQIERLYHAAREREPGQRERFLQEACAGDEELRHELESLLRHEPQAESFLEATALEVTAQSLAKDRAQAMIGRTLGHYQIVSLLGAGGMGEVYRARDTRLQREVAVKILPPHLATDAAMAARFEREAKAIAALSHPNILAIHDFGIEEGVSYAVMELLEGENLRARLERSPLAWREAVEITMAIAEGLAAAHAKGITHRDLKPENIFLASDGRVKILDFNLAQVRPMLLGENAGAAAGGPSLTELGMLIGTVGYMSPEQVEGERVDARSDIFSFGAVLYEMVTGRRAFQGHSKISTLAAILHPQPQPVSAIAAGVPGELEGLIFRCLRKDPEQRWQQMADLKMALQQLAERDGGSAASARHHAWRVLLLASAFFGWIGRALQHRSFPWAIVAATGIGALVWILVRPVAVAPPTVTSLTVPLAPENRMAIDFLPAVAFSQDGSRLLYAARGKGPGRLFLRLMDQFEATPIPGTEGAAGPFFSPDGRWAGFFAHSKLKKVSLSGSAPQVLCEAPGGRGGSWGADDTIVFASGSAPGIGLSRISAAGGTPRALTTPDADKGEVGHRWPEILPGGQEVLFTIWTGGGFDTARIAVLSLQSGKHRVLIEGGSDAHYASTGHLIFHRAGGLLAAPFDLTRLKVTGQLFPILQGVASDLRSGAAQFSVSGSGSLAYVPGGAVSAESSLVWVDRKGTAQPLMDTRRDYFFPRISPEAQRLAVRVNRDIWVYGISDQTFNRLTFEAGLHNYPIWTPDGQRIVFTSNRFGVFNLFWKPADGSGAEERLTISRNPQLPSSWSTDGKWLTFDESDPTTGTDIWVLHMSGDRKPRPLLQTPSDESGAVFSPDGRCLSYTSNQSGRFEVYVQVFPEGSARWQISSDGGTEPVWARNGRELFFRNGDKMMAVDVTTDPKFHAGKPRLLFEGRYEAYSLTTSYDVAPDGHRFLMVKTLEPAPAPAQFNVVLNWFEELKRGAAVTRR